MKYLLKVITILAAVMAWGFASTPVTAEDDSEHHLRLSSTTFANGAPQLPLSMIFDRCTSTGVKGGNQSPELSWKGVPEDTRSFVVILYDPVADFTHWGMYNISGEATGLAANAGVSGSPDGSQVFNDFGDPFYDGPCPPTSLAPQTHLYVFTLYALDEELVLPAFGDFKAFTPTGEALYQALIKAALQGHILDTATIDGFYSATIPPGP
jgi:Raf kinase inhibitor-like YbhB/YbcL family protein